MKKSELYKELDKIKDPVYYFNKYTKEGRIKPINEKQWKLMLEVVAGIKKIKPKEINESFEKKLTRELFNKNKKVEKKVEVKKKK